VRVRFLLPDAYGMGGRVRSVFNLAGSLALRHDVQIASLDRRAPEPAQPLPPAVELVPLLSEAALNEYVTAATDGVLIGTRPDLVMAIAEHRRPGVATVGQEHFHLGRYGKPMRARMQQWYPLLGAHVSLTRDDAAAYRALLGERPPTLCIPNAVDGPVDLTAELVNPVVVAAGRLAHQKGYDRLMRAWRLVHDEHPDWRLRILGEGDKRADLEAQRDRLGLSDVVELPGFSDRLDEELAAASLFVLSSRFEGLPMVVLEAMAIGLPVVSFDCPTGPHDLIGPAEGMLVPNGRVRALADAIGTMIELGPQRRRALGAAARTRSEQYHLPAVTSQWEQLFGRLTTSGGAPTTIT
jgi:glycosyltransferase involved in cell wall biosynthesis